MEADSSWRGYCRGWMDEPKVGVGVEDGLGRLVRRRKLGKRVGGRPTVGGWPEGVGRWAGHGALAAQRPAEGHVRRGSALFPAPLLAVSQLRAMRCDRLKRVSANLHLAFPPVPYTSLRPRPPPSYAPPLPITRATCAPSPHSRLPIPRPTPVSVPITELYLALPHFMHLLQCNASPSTQWPSAKYSSLTVRFESSHMRSD